MAVNPQKFLPSLNKETTSEVLNAKRSSIVLSQNSVKNVATIRVKVIQIESILKGTLASEKKALDQKKRKESTVRRERQEEKLETKTSMGMGGVKMPQRPRLGIFDWIKNFIGNIIVGYFAVRLIEHLPKIMPIVNLLAKAGDLIVDFGGKLLNGLSTFIDWGYKAVDFSRGLVGKTFGDDALKNFDKLTSEFEKFMNLAIIVGMASADFGMNRLDRRMSGKSAERVAEKGAGTATRRGAGRTATRAGARLGGRGGAKLASKIGSKALKAIPFLGAGLAIVEGIMRIREGDIVGGLLSFGTAIPVAGWAFLALDIAREFMGGPEFDKSVGKSLSGKPIQPNKQITKAAGGGITRGGKSKGSVKRTVSRKGKGRYKRVIRKVPQKPGKVEITSPGADVGGEKKVFDLFGFVKGAVDKVNPFNAIKKSGEELGKTDYFGPILAITSKIIAGQKPNQQDYKNVGLGINLLLAKGIQDKQLKGGVVAAFAEGGLVDPDVLSAVETGGDISNWVAKTFQGEIESNAQKTLRLIKENSDRKKLEQPAPTADDMGIGPGVQVSSDSEDFWLLATAAMFENSDPQGAADVAQVIYNRTKYAAWNAPTIKKAILNPGQFQPVRQYGGTGAWSQIKDKNSAIAFARSHGKSVEQLERVAAALLSKEKQDSARAFVGPRDSFRADAYERANNHLADETEKSRFGHTFGFEPGGAMIGQFKAGKLSAAMVNANVIGNVNMRGGDGRFIQGNSGSSQGTHFHIGTTKPGDGSGVATAGFNVIKHFLGKKSIYVGRSKENIPANATDEQIRGYIARGQAAHRQTELDLQIGGTGAGNKVPFPLALKGMRYSATDGYGVSADVVGVNAFVGHGRYKPDGSLAPQQGISLSSGAPDFYAFHGMNRLMTKDGLLKFHKGEYISVTDADSFRLFGNILTEINSVENKAQLVLRVPSIIEKLRAISGYADYEQAYGQSEIIEVPVPVPVIIGGDSSSTMGGLIPIASGSGDNPYKGLYKGG